jgi:hypothetical protein
MGQSAKTRNMLFATLFYKYARETEKTQGEPVKQKAAPLKVGILFTLAPLHRTVHINHRKSSVATGVPDLSDK